MKKTVRFLVVLALGTLSSQIALAENKIATSTIYRYSNPFIFVEEGITFSVYPDGEFDFYIDKRINVAAGTHIGNVEITFNSGYNYNPYVQYDDYGAVIQVEHIPIYYDYYGRVSRIGRIPIGYINGRIRNIGGLYVYYNRDVLSHCTGFINSYNRYYVYRPFHRYFVRPAVGFCNVYHRPYRRYYTPTRYVYYRPYTYNPRRAHVAIGRTYRNHNQYRRDHLYRNNQSVATRSNHSTRQVDVRRNNKAVAQNASRTREGASRTNNTATRQVAPQRSVQQHNAGKTQRTNPVNRAEVHKEKTVLRSSKTVARRSPGNTKYRSSNSSIARVP